MKSKQHPALPLKPLPKPSGVAREEREVEPIYEI
jgi:hypothetical protein